MLHFLFYFLCFNQVYGMNTINLNENNMVNIRGPIDSDSTNKFFQDIMKLDKENELNIFINSPGGSVMEGLRIVSYIEMLNNNLCEPKVEHL